MDYDFQITQKTLQIPSSAFLPVKRCPFCQSVFINDKNCESCERSMLYHPIGKPFGAKSMYGIKERYIESLGPINQIFPFLENKKSPIAKSYLRKLEKRFVDLLSAFNTQGMISSDERKLFYVESLVLVDEMQRYGVGISILQSLLKENDNSLTGQELLDYLEASKSFTPSFEKSRIKLFLEFPLWGILKVEFLLKVSIITATILIMAVKYKDIISSQFGK
jgi:hypothetical protein